MHSRSLALVAVLTAGPAVHGAGYYNMPTSLPQCLGVGFGPGHHAPLVLGPWWKAKITAQRVQRLPAPLAPPVGCEFGAASCWDAGYSHATSPAHGDPWGAFAASPAPYGGAATTLADPSAVPAPMLAAPVAPPGAESIPAPAPTGR